MAMKSGNILGVQERSDPDLLQVGQMAQARGDTAMALQFWGKHRERRPLDPAGYLLSGSLLRELKRLDEADSVLQEGLCNCPDALSLSIEHAWVTQDREIWPEALERWQRVLAKFPFHPVATGCVVQALIKLELYTEANAQLKTIRQIFPDSYYFAVLSAEVATKQQDFPEALMRWKGVRAIKPDCEIAASHLAVIQKIVAPE